MLQSMKITTDPRDQFFDTKHLHDNLMERTSRATFLVYLFAIVKTLFQVGSTAVLARLISPSEYGVVALAMPAVLIAVGLAEFGLAEVMVQRPLMTQNIASSLFWLNLCLGLLLALAIVLLAVPAVNFYNDPRVGPIFFAFGSMAILSSLVAQYIAILRRKMLIRAIEQGTFGAMACSVAIAIILAKMGAGYWAIVSQTILTPALMLLFFFLSCRWIPSAPWRTTFSEARSSLAFGGSLAGSRLLTQIAHNLGLAIVGHSFSDVQAGLYYRTWTLANLPNTRFFGTLAGAYIHPLSRLQDDPVKFSDLFIRMILRMNLLAMPLGIFICSSADLIVQTVLGEDWVGAEDILKWLGILSFVAPAFYGCQWSLLAIGKVKSIFYFRLFYAVSVACAFYFGSYFGLEKMVTAFSLTLLVIVVPLAGYITIRDSSITLRDLVDAFLFDMIFAGVAFVSLLFMRHTMIFKSAFVEIVIVSIAIGLAYLIRVLLQTKTRRIFLQSVQRIFR